MNKYRVRRFSDKGGFGMKYRVRINCEEHDIAPERWPTLTAENYTQATTAAKPWIDAGYLVEITPVSEGTDPGE